MHCGVLEISQHMNEFTGDANATQWCIFIRTQPSHTNNAQYGVIADCYTELGDFEAAALNYDKYITKMNTDGPV